MCNDFLKDIRKGPTLPGVWNFYPLKITLPSSDGTYLSPRNHRGALLQEDASLDPSTELFSITFYGELFSPLPLCPVGGRNASFLSLLLCAKDRLDKDGDPRPTLAISKHQPENCVGRDDRSELALQCPPIDASFSAMKKCMLSVVEGPSWPSCLSSCQRI